MSKEQALRQARKWTKQSGHIAYVLHFHGTWTWAEQIDHAALGIITVRS